MSIERFILVGNPENRRVTSFSAAVVDAGLPPPIVVSWAAIARSGAAAAFSGIDHQPAFVRLDSFGESAEVEAELLRLGFEDVQHTGASIIDPAEASTAVAQRGRIVCPRQAHLGFLRLLRELSTMFDERPEWVILNPPRAIAELFDKRITSALYAANGLRVPPAFQVENLEALRALPEVASAGAAKNLYLKLSCGSSASGLANYHRTASGEYLMTTVEVEGEAFFNSLIVRRVDRPADVERILRFILGEGAQVEASIPKARLDNYYFDLRILVIDGVPAFTVMRQSRHPITNLHLGGRRGELSRLPPGALERAQRAAEHAASLHGTQHVGVDVLLEAKTLEPHVLEANAFGDLLPNLTRDGLSVYAFEIASARSNNPSPKTRAKPSFSR